MLRYRWNDNWQFCKGGPSMMSILTGGPAYQTIQLPHDAMIHEERDPETKNGTQTGFYPGGLYTYIKKLNVPEEWQNKTVVLEFEGVYEKAMVYVNGNLAKTNLNGYSNFYVTLDKFLEYGQENEIRVIADNASEQNSRWYSGSGIYRNVHLMIGSRIHIPEDGVKVTTVSAEESISVIEVSTKLRNLTRKREKVTVKVDVSQDGKIVGTDTIGVTMFSEAEEMVYQTICVNQASLWCPENPTMYLCHVQICSEQEILDEEQMAFGIRTLQLDAQRGLRINGKQVKLRGTCIHHDNGVIGAATFENAEERRCRQIKEAGFNSIRSAHHPMSKAMLDACDRYGILVMDELSDMWTNHKNANDYALHFLEYMEEEARRMVDKDYNHPSVIMYSVGNEIPDVGTPRGAQINRQLCNLLHSLDASRYTTNAINGMLTLGVKIKKVMQDLMSEQQKSVKHSSGKKEEGASGLNGLMAFMVGEMADKMATHPIMTETLDEASQSMDIIGLNYLTGRHVLEKEIHPNKTIVGAETFPSDIVRLWDIVKHNNHVLGDYTWTGYDYLGEAGCGIFYYDGTQNFSGVYPDRVAYIGDINLIGYRRPISYLREIVFGLRKEPYIAVERVDKYGMKHSQTAWMWKDNISSWTWHGYEGKPAKVDVYSADEEVELFLNGNSLGRKVTGEQHKFTATYEITYEPGELLAVGYQNGEESGRYLLQTANEHVQLQVECENDVLKANGSDLAFVTVKLTDDEGRENLFVEKEITIHVEGAGILQGFGNADPRAIGSYDDTTWKTYDGYVMAVIRSENQPGKIHVIVEADGCEAKELTIDVE